MMSVIVHFIWRDSLDKFPVGYINFMKLRMPEYEHHFFVKTVDETGTLHCRLNLCNNENVYYYDNLLLALLKSNNFRLLSKCSKIIVSGWCLSGKTRAFLILSGLISKTYLHFWAIPGRIDENLLTYILHPRRTLNRFLRHIFIKKSAGTINLIEGDLEALLQIYPNNTKHFIAPMPGDPLKQYDFASAIAQSVRNSVCRILIGHSAYESVQHMETFRILEHLKDANIEIVCPLSYGNSEYREKVIYEGRRIFGEKFTPILDFMSKEEYIRFLASCDVGVFLTETQQGMGNISLLIRLGKKVFIREDTSMWQQYKLNLKYYVYSVSELEGITLQQLADFPRELAYNNIHLAEEYAANNHAVTQWRKVFND